MAGPRVVVLTHLRQGLPPKSLVARLTRGFWRAAGIEVVVHQGLRGAPAGDLAILHVDLTVTPPEYLTLGARYPRCLNLAVTDISKRRISRSLVTADDGYDGPVIVKTDRNHGGRPEHLLWLGEAGWPRRLGHMIGERLPMAWTRRLRKGRYLVLDSKRQVPDWVWETPALVVERLLSERHGERSLMHQWWFFGTADANMPTYGPGRFVDFQRPLDRQPPHREVPEELRQRRRELGLDFGKIDYVMHDGRAVMLDANRTPVLEEPDLGRLAMLAPGLWPFLEGG